MSDWRTMAEAPRDGRIIWLGDEHNVRLGFWVAGHTHHTEASDRSNGGWIDFARAENGECVRSLYFKPLAWQPIPLPVKVWP